VFDKIKQLGKLKQMRDEAMKIQKELAQEKIEMDEDGIKVIITGDQKLQYIEIDGTPNNRVVEVINRAVKKSQEMAAKKLQSMSGGLGGLLGGLGG
jgi:nucleoid-associated protein EbfC